jgi:hypothetical protein
VLKRLTLYSCSRRVPVQRFTANTPVCAPDLWSAGAGIRKQTVGWEHNAPEAVSETRRWSTTDSLADHAGWTEVVIPRGQYVLIDLPVGPTMADVTSISSKCCATHSGGISLYNGGDSTTGSGATSRWSDNVIAVACLDDHACGRRNLPEVDRISCPNNYEVTL